MGACAVVRRGDLPDVVTDMIERGDSVNAVIPQKELKEIFDQTTRSVTEQAAGIILNQGDDLPAGELYTVYTTFERGFDMRVAFCAEAALLIRLTKYMMQADEVTRQDMEDFTKEYFNMLCGQIASRLFQVTKVASRFGIPCFCQGRYVPGDEGEHFVISYISDGNENAQLIHHLPKKL